MSTSQTTADHNLDADYGSGTPATVYACLTTSAPSETGDGTIVEPTGGQYDTYVEQAITNNAGNFPAAAAGVKTTGVAINFPIAGSGSTNNTPLTHLVFRTASGGGRIIDALPLPTGTVVVIGQGLSFPAGSVTITEG